MMTLAKNDRGSVNNGVNSYAVRARGGVGRTSCVESVHGLDPCTRRARGKLYVATEDLQARFPTF